MWYLWEDEQRHLGGMSRTKSYRKLGEGGEAQGWREHAQAERPEVALCRRRIAREDSNMEMLAPLMATVNPTDKWAQGLSSALPTEGNWDTQGQLRLGHDFEGKILLSSHKLKITVHVCRVCGDDFV